MKKRFLAVILVMALVLTSFTMPSKAEAAMNEAVIGGMGYIPLSDFLSDLSIEDRAALCGASVYTTDETAFPTSFNLVDRGLVTSVKNQGSYGTCWAHAACASMESNALMRNLGTYKSLYSLEEPI